MALYPVGKRLGACLKTPAKRRVGTHGLQNFAVIRADCRPGALTGRVFKQALTREDLHCWGVEVAMT